MRTKIREHGARPALRGLQLISVLLVVGASFGLWWGGTSPVGAQTSGEPIVVNVIETTPKGQVRYPNVDITVKQGEKTVLKLTTDAQGQARADLPGSGKFTVTLDESTLPSGKKLRDGTAASTEIDTTTGSAINVRNFPIGAGQATDGGVTFSALIANTVSGLRFGLLIGLCAIGLSLIFGTTGLTNFAHGEMVTFGAAIAVLLNNNAKIPLLIAAPIAVLVGGGAGAMNEMIVWRPLRDGRLNTPARVLMSALLAPIGAFFVVKVALSSARVVDRLVIIAIAVALFGGALVAVWKLKRNLSTSLVGQLVVSIGLSILFRYLLYLMIGGRTQYFHDFNSQKGLKFGPVVLTPNDIVTSLLAIVVLVGVGLFLQKTRLGKAIRAVSDNRPLAASSGIDVERVILTVWILGGAMAALGGISLTLGNAGIKFDSGGILLLLMFAGVTLGGLGTAYGALVGSLVIGVLVQVWPLFFAPDLKEVGALVVLVLILLVRPQGIMGKAQRIG